MPDPDLQPELPEWPMDSPEWPHRVPLPPPPPPRPPKRGWFRWAVLAVVAAGLILPFTPAGRRVYRAVDRLVARRAAPPEVRVEPQAVEPRVVERVVVKEVPAATPTDEPPPLPDAPVLNASSDLRTLFNGLKLESHFLPEAGRNAAVERKDRDSYGVEFTVRVRVPEPAKSLAELAALNPALPEILPALPAMVGSAKVSGFYHYLYGLKQKAIQQSIMQLDRVLSRHNFYDLETILQLEHPDTKGRVLLMQAEMDVVSDGSDGDRMTNFDNYIFKSQHFQPSTSYGWRKLTDKVNPLVPRFEAKLEEAKQKLKGTGLSRTEKASLESSLKSIPGVIADLKKRSYLIAQEDPFIVIPLSLRQFKGSRTWTPGIGDYAVVIAGDKIMPAIVGDYGPSIKVGEASLRIARELNPEAGPYNRPISDLTVTYLIFPGSADKPAQPNYDTWHRRCSELLATVGGLADGRSLHRWEDRLKPAPADAPADAAAAAGGSTPTATPATTSPAPSPSSTQTP